MASRTLLRRIAAGLVCALLFAQMAVATHACAKAPAGPLAPSAAAPAAAPDCHEADGAPDSTTSSLCAEHCKQGQQSDRAQLGIALPPTLLSPLYATPAAAEPAVLPPQGGAWLSALVAASPPHAIAHCVLRI